MKLTSWFPLFVALLFASAAMGGLFLVFEWGYEPNFAEAPRIGHVTRAYGTVKKARIPVSHYPESQRRLETGRSLLAPLRLGEQIQTGEDSAAEVLFFGGTTLHMEAASLASFEDNGDDIAIRLILGRAFLEVPPQGTIGPNGPTRFVYRDAEGSHHEIPNGKKLVLTLNALEKLEEAVEVTTVEADPAAGSLENLELRALAIGEQIGGRHSILVEPIRDTGRFAHASEWKYRSPVPVPKILYPPDQAELALSDPNTPMLWRAQEKNSSTIADPVVRYEVSVRPAFGYEVEDTARKNQTFAVSQPEFPMGKINGGGVFLWSVRSVTASGRRSPASDSRWLELKFPKILFAPDIMKPKVTH